MRLRAHNASSIYIIHKNILREKLRNHIVITYHNPQNLITWHPHSWLRVENYAPWSGIAAHHNMHTWHVRTNAYIKYIYVTILRGKEKYRWLGGVFFLFSISSSICRIIPCTLFVWSLPVLYTFRMKLTGQKS